MVELLAPAGNRQCLDAAAGCGADAIYFGLAEPYNFNARSRAENFSLETLSETIAYLHKRGIRGYVALNTLLFRSELKQAEYVLEKVAEADTDAIIVQDFGLAKLAAAVCKELPLHCSTQMSLTSAGSIAVAQSLGIKRVVLPRELSLRQIRRIRKETNIELECFVHGALCISFSGQCYASLGLGGRSANRGACAQPCRLPYKIVSGQRTASDNPLTVGNYLSPTDFSSLPLLKDLLETGINALKIEGRLKSPEYVAETVRIYRQAIDEHFNPNRLRLVEKSDFQTFSRGLSIGWLDGVNPHRLVPGNVQSHKGTLLGTVIEVRRDAVVVLLSAPAKRGDGVLFENKTLPDKAQGGRIYEIIRRQESVKNAEAGVKVLLTFANNSLNAEFIAEGQSVWKTDDPKLDKKLQQAENGVSRLTRRLKLDVKIEAVVGHHLKLAAFSPLGAKIFIRSEIPLDVARKHPLTVESLREQLDRLGDTLYQLGNLDAVILGNPMLPLSVLGQVRKQLVEQLNAFEPPRHERTIHRNALGTIETLSAKYEERHIPPPFITHYLFRSIADFQRVAPTLKNCSSFYGEFRSIEEYKQFAECVKAVHAEFVAVLPRILKPGESKILQRIAELKPDAVLARNLEELAFFRRQYVPVITDFSLNIVNDLAFQQLLDWGAERITLGFDLFNKPVSEAVSTPVEELLQHIPRDKIELIVAGRLPLFTMEHCFWKAKLFKEHENCNKICRSVPLQIEDRYGAVHTVRSDYFCRNIIERSEPFESEPLVQHIRIEYDERTGTFMR